MRSKFVEVNSQEKALAEIKTHLDTFWVTDVTPEEVMQDALKYCKGKRISAVSTEILMEMFQVMTMLIVGEKSKTNVHKGYCFAYVFNIDERQFSELGDVYVEKIGNDFYRAG
jgi:hypothetical protein